LVVTTVGRSVTAMIAAETTISTPVITASTHVGVARRRTSSTATTSRSVAMAASHQDARGVPEPRRPAPTAALTDAHSAIVQTGPGSPNT